MPTTAPVHRFVRGRCIAERFTTPDDQHDITAGTKRQAFSRRSTIIMPSHFRQHGIIDGLAISTQDGSEGIDVVGETSSPIHFRRPASTEAKSLRRRGDVPANHFATTDINRRERSRRKEDCPTKSFTTQDATQSNRHQRGRRISRRETLAEGDNPIGRTVNQRKQSRCTSDRVRQEPCPSNRQHRTAWSVGSRPTNVQHHGDGGDHVGFKPDSADVSRACNSSWGFRETAPPTPTSLK